MKLLLLLLFANVGYAQNGTLKLLLGAKWECRNILRDTIILKKIKPLKIYRMVNTVQFKREDNLVKWEGYFSQPKRTEPLFICGNDFGVNRISYSTKDENHITIELEASDNEDGLHVYRFKKEFLIARRSKNSIWLIKTRSLTK